MNVQEITFGVEIECYVPAGSIQAGAYHNGLPIPGFPVGWNAQHDGSLGYRRGREAVEIVSPVLKGSDGVRQVKEVLAKLNQMGATVGKKCGFHVHVGFAADASNLQKLVHLTANFEKALYATTGTKSREQGHYCRPIRSTFRTLQFVDGAPVGQIGRAAYDRYHSLNLSNLVTQSKPTVEFRAFAGSLNFGKVAAYIRLCVGMVERALKMARATNWEATRPVETSPIHRSGEGQTELTRLFYQLGWTKGRQSHTHGDLTGEGLPTIGQSKKALMDLARKYDARE